MNVMYLILVIVELFSLLIWGPKYLNFLTIINHMTSMKWIELKVMEVMYTGKEFSNISFRTDTSNGGTLVLKREDVKSGEAIKDLDEDFSQRKLGNLKKKP
jgi:hypothetical protein